MGWLAGAPVAEAAAGPDPSTATLLLDAALAALWVSGLQAVLFGLLPLRFLPGEKVVRWSRAGWLAIYGTALFLFVHAVARPGGDEGDVTSEATAWSMAVLLALFSLAALGTWAWFRFAAPRRHLAETLP